MRGLTRDGTTESVSQDQILRRERGKVDYEQNWQSYPVDTYSSIIIELCDSHTYILSTSG